MVRYLVVSLPSYLFLLCPHAAFSRNADPLIQEFIGFKVEARKILTALDASEFLSLTGMNLDFIDFLKTSRRELLDELESPVELRDKNPNGSCMETRGEKNATIFLSKQDCREFRERCKNLQANGVPMWIATAAEHLGKSVSFSSEFGTAAKLAWETGLLLTGIFGQERPSTTNRVRLYLNAENRLEAEFGFFLNLTDGSKAYIKGPLVLQRSERNVVPNFTSVGTARKMDCKAEPCEFPIDVRTWVLRTDVDSRTEGDRRSSIGKDRTRIRVEVTSQEGRTAQCHDFREDFVRVGAASGAFRSKRDQAYEWIAQGMSADPSDLPAETSTIPLNTEIALKTDLKLQPAHISAGIGEIAGDSIPQFPHSTSNIYWYEIKYISHLRYALPGTTAKVLPAGSRFRVMAVNVTETHLNYYLTDGTDRYVLSSVRMAREFGGIQYQVRNFFPLDARVSMEIMSRFVQIPAQ